MLVRVFDVLVWMAVIRQIDLVEADRYRNRLRCKRRKCYFKKNNGTE